MIVCDDCGGNPLYAYSRHIEKWTLRKRYDMPRDRQDSSATSEDEPYVLREYLDLCDPCAKKRGWVITGARNAEVS